MKLCVITFFITFFWNNAKTWVSRTTLNGRKRGIAVGDLQKNYATPTNEAEDLGQTSNWSKLVAAYLPVARLTILDRLVEGIPNTPSIKPFERH